jgi:hypothetical protein
MTESVYDWKNDDETPNRNQTNDYLTNYDNPLNSFLYALKSSEAKRQYPARLMKFFDYLEIENNGLNFLLCKDFMNNHQTKIKDLWAKTRISLDELDKEKDELTIK